MSDQEHVTRITERLRRDHPDPKLRAQLYEAGRLPEYVRALAPDLDDAAIERIARAVREAEDGQLAQ